MEERLDILNEAGEKTDASQTYDEVHRNGLIHRTVHIWFLNSQNQLLLQKRSKNKRAYPNYWDISAAGHVSAGETSIEAAGRETREELGLSLSQLEFQYIFSVEEHIVLNEGTYVNNEFQDVYLVRIAGKLRELKLSGDEVAETKWIDINELKVWLLGGGEALVPHDEEYRKLIEHLESKR